MSSTTKTRAVPGKSFSILHIETNARRRKDGREPLSAFHLAHRLAGHLDIKEDKKMPKPELLVPFRVFRERINNELAAQGREPISATEAAELLRRHNQGKKNPLIEKVLRNIETGNGVPV